MIDFPIINYEPSIAYEGIYPLIPLSGNKGGSKIELSFQVTPPGFVPFSIIPYIPKVFNLRIEDVSGIISSNELNNPKPDFNIKYEKFR